MDLKEELKKVKLDWEIEKEEWIIKNLNVTN